MNDTSANTVSNLIDVKALRQQARKQIEDGAVTAGYRADRSTLATELVCVLRYRRHYFMARGLASQSIAGEFLTHFNEEQGHADRIAERIAIDSYREMIRYLDHDDPTSSRMLKDTLAVEEEHAEELSDLLAGRQDPTLRR